jgi:nicotinamide-nucleotide amidase
MAQDALARSAAQVSLAVTGVAGPGGGSPAKPVGTVWFAWGVSSQVHSQKMHFTGDRTAVRRAAVSHALQGLTELLRS